jgi:AAA family ATP:ADP antiporter
LPWTGQFLNNAVSGDQAMTNDPGARPPGDSATPPGAPKSLVERLLAPIADVRRGEAASALLLMLTMFLILSAYYLLKTAREVFILSEGGAEVKSYSSAGQAILLLVLVPIYGAFASRVGRVQLTQWVTLFFVLHIFFFLAALRAGLHVGIPYFLWVGIFNLMVIAQFWAFANDIYTPEQGKRLFPLIGVGSSLGAWVGSVRAGQLVESVGTSRLLLAAAATLVVCALLPRAIDRVARRTRGRTGAPSRAAAAAPASEPAIGGPNGFAMIFSSRYLLLIALLTMLLNVVNTSGEYLFSRYVVDTANTTFGTGAAAAAAREQFIGSVYSRLFSTVNLLGFLLQMFVVSRLFAWLGIGGSLFVHPVVAFAGYLMMLRAPSIQTMGWLKVLDNSIDYSLGNTTKQALWLPTSREAKYKAKQAVDSFFVRAGDVLQAGLVFVGERLAFAVPAFATINLALVGLWLAVVVALNGLLRPAKAGGTDRLQAAT